MYGREIIPDGEEHMHTPFGGCPCEPIIRHTKSGMMVIWHRSFDHREWWMGVEIMLGIRCKEHIAPVIRGQYEVGKPHSHIEPPEPYYEYEHQK